MTYQNVRTPRFYPCLINFLLSRGIAQDGNFDVESGADLISTFTSGSEAELFDMKPLNKCSWDTSSTSALRADHILININKHQLYPTFLGTNYLAILNHNMHSADAKVRFCFSNTEAKVQTVDFATPDGTLDGQTAVLNAAGLELASDIVTIAPAADGHTIVTFNAETTQYMGIQFEGNSSYTFSDDTDLFVGCIMTGQYWDAPHSPDLAVKRSIEFENKIQQSLGGQRFSNMVSHGREMTSTTKSPFAILGDQNPEVFGGRLNYDMKFSYLSSANVMPSDYSVTSTSDDSVATDLWNMTNGSHIPFIFTPDGTSTTVGDYLFARFNQNKLDMTQVANDTWNIGMKISEEF